MSKTWSTRKWYGGASMKAGVPRYWNIMIVQQDNAREPGVQCFVRYKGSWEKTNWLFYGKIYIFVD